MKTQDVFQIAIGSQNKAKIHAVELAFSTLFPDSEYSLFPVQVESGVGVQPYGFEATIRGAKSRANAAFSEVFGIKPNQEKSIGVGIEAGMVPVPLSNTGYMDFQFCAIYNNNNDFSIGCGPAFEYPQSIVHELLKDTTYHEIGTIIADLSGIPNTKEHEGAIGFLSKNTLYRAEILKYSVIMALLPLKCPDRYSS